MSISSIFYFLFFFCLQGAANHMFRAGPPGPSHGVGLLAAGSAPGQPFSSAVMPSPATRGFAPITVPGFVQRPGASPVQPSSSTQPAQPTVVAARPTSPPTVQTADTSSVAGNFGGPLFGLPSCSLSYLIANV